MSKKCSICSNYNFKEINRRIAFMPTTGESYQDIAKDYQNVTAEALRWHVRSNHMSGGNTVGNGIKTEDRSGVMKGGMSGDNTEGDFNPDLMIPEAEKIAWNAYADAIKAGDMTLAVKALAVATELTKMRREDEASGRLKKEEAKLDYSVLSDEEIDIYYRLSCKIRGDLGKS